MDNWIVHLKAGIAVVAALVPIGTLGLCPKPYLGGMFMDRAFVWLFGIIVPLMLGAEILRQLGVISDAERWLAWIGITAAFTWRAYRHFR